VSARRSRSPSRSPASSPDARRRVPASQVLRVGSSGDYMPFSVRDETG
jgi:hypothetical protein